VSLRIVEDSRLKELNDYFEVWDAELKAKDARIMEAESEIARLASEVRKQNIASQSGSASLIQMGCEQDLYEVRFWCGN